MSNSADVLKHLKGLKSAWDTAKVDPDIDKGGFTRHPDGKYRMDLTGFDIGPSNSSGRMQIAWEWTIMEGELAGETQGDYDGIESPDSFKYILKKLKQLGVGIHELDIEELPALGEALVKARPQAIIQLRTGKPHPKTGERYQNLFINRVLGMGDATEEEGGDEQEKTEDQTAARVEVKPVAEPTADEVLGIGDKVAWVEDGQDKMGLVRGFTDDTRTAAQVISGGKTYSILVENMTVVEKASRED